jgi:hypothetical protein
MKQKQNTALNIDLFEVLEGKLLMARWHVDVTLDVLKREKAKRGTRFTD